MKCYFVTEAKTSKPIRRCRRIGEIVALLHSNKISESFLVAEASDLNYIYDKMIQSGEAKWTTVAQILFETYKDFPIAPIIVKDLDTNYNIISERYYTKTAPLPLASNVMRNYFYNNYMRFPKHDRKDYLVFCMSDQCPPLEITYTLVLEDFVESRGIIGSDEPPFEKTFPYSIEESQAREIPLPVEFIELEAKRPKYDPMEWEIGDN